jgi:hypothetical protein
VNLLNQNPDDLHESRMPMVVPVILAACFWLTLSLGYGPEKRDTAKCEIIDTPRDRYGVRVCLGMTKEEVTRAVGLPLKVVSADGRANLREQWVYSTHYGRPKHLFFKNELLVSFQQ